VRQDEPIHAKRLRDARDGTQVLGVLDAIQGNQTAMRSPSGHFQELKQSQFRKRPYF
jgi:hypothetical protein